MENKIPQHISVIMDGNGRWAKERGKERVFGHLNGVESVRAVTEACVEHGVKYLSLYAFSEENWNRPQAEVSYLMQLMQKAIGDEVETLMKNGVRFRVLGNRARLAPMLNESITKLEEMTAGNERLTMIIFLSYSGKWDIFQAAAKMARAMQENPDAKMEIGDFDQYLVTAGYPDPDLIIRPSGEYRLSNFLLWQSAYAELYFTDTLWPDFDERALDAAIIDYQKRDRRFGGVK